MVPSIPKAGGGGGSKDGVTKEIPGTKISVTPPPKTLKDIPPKPIIVQPIYVKPHPHKAKLQIQLQQQFPMPQFPMQQFPMPYFPMQQMKQQPRNLNQQVFVSGASVQNGGTDGSIVLDGEDQRDLKMTPILQHQRQVTLNTHSIQKLELTHQNNEGIKFALQKLVENVAGLDSLQEELIHKIEAKVEIYEALVQETKNPDFLNYNIMKFFLFLLILNTKCIKILTKDQLEDGFLPHDVVDEISKELRYIKTKKAAKEIFLFVKNNFFKEIYFYFHNTRQLDEEKFQKYIIKHFRLQIEDDLKHINIGDKKEEIKEAENEEKILENFEETQQIPLFKEVYSVYDTANKYKLFSFRIHAQGTQYVPKNQEETITVTKKGERSLVLGFLKSAVSTVSNIAGQLIGSTKEVKATKFQSYMYIYKKFMTCVLFNKDSTKEFSIEYSLYNNDKYLEFQSKQIHSFLQNVNQHVFSVTQIQDYMFKALKIELFLFPQLKNQLANQQPKNMQNQEIFEVNPAFNLEPELNRQSLQDAYKKKSDDQNESKKINQFYVQMISPLVHENAIVLDMFKQRIQQIQFFQDENLNDYIEEKEWVVFALTPVDTQQDLIFMYGVFKYLKDPKLQQDNGMYFYTESNQLNQQFEIKTLTFNFLVQQFNFILKEVKQNILFYFEQIQIDFKGQKADVDKIKEILPDILYRNEDDTQARMVENIQVEDKYILEVSNGSQFYSKKSYPIFSQFNPFTNMQYYYQTIQNYIDLVENPCPLEYELQSDGKCHSKNQIQNDVVEYNKESKHIKVYAENLKQDDTFRAQEMVLAIRWHEKRIGSFEKDTLESFQQETLMEPEFYCKWDFAKTDNHDILLLK